MNVCVCMCMYVCMYVCLYVCMYVWVPRSLAPIKKDHLRPKSTVYISTNNHLGWELGGTEVLGVGTGDRGLRLGEVLQ